MYTNELYHHGVKGMKWGVRKDPRETFLGRRRISKAHNVNKRLNKIAMLQRRRSKMSARQTESFNRAREYWKNVEKTGSYKGPENNHRGFIRRNYDTWRSRDLNTRGGMYFGYTTAHMMLREVGKKAVVNAAGFPDADPDGMLTKAGKSVGTGLISTPLNLVNDWAIAKVSGHF